MSAYMLGIIHELRCYLSISFSCQEYVYHGHCSRLDELFYTKSCGTRMENFLIDWSSHDTLFSIL